MKTETRTRAFLPIMIPLAILGAIATIVGLFALILLYNTRVTAVVIAIVAAAAILFAMALATSQDTLDGAKKGVVALVGILPFVLGGLVATGVLGDLAEGDLNINREPHLAGPQLAEIPEDAPVLAAESLNAFCIPTASGCEETNEWDIPSEAAAGEVFEYVFDNRDTVTGPHNLVLFGLAGTADAPEAGDLLLDGVPAAWPGPEIRAFQTNQVLPEQFYFLCTIHPNTMWGVGTIGA